MKTAEFSESSYAFAIVRELSNGAHGNVIGAPEFPTLRQEGGDGGGFDVKIKYQLAAVFYQFKVPQVIRRSSKYQPKGFSLPYYRIPLRTQDPNQHKLLIDLESSGKLVFYSTPLFHQGQELNRNYVHSVVARRSSYFRPAAIGVLDSEKHHIAYSPKSRFAWAYSEPVQITGGISSSAAMRSIENAIERAPRQTQSEFLSDLGDLTVRLINRPKLKSQTASDASVSGTPAKVDESEIDEQVVKGVQDKPHKSIDAIPREFNQISKMVRSRLSCELFVFGRRARS